MRSFVFTVIAVCTFVFLFPSCDGEGNRAETFQGDTLEVRYASHLQMVECMGYTLVNLRNPWDTLRTLHSYILMPRDKEYNADTLPKGTVVRVPLQRSVIYTSVHCGLVNEWRALDGVAGVCDVKYIHQDEVLQRLADGLMTDL